MPSQISTFSPYNDGSVGSFTSSNSDDDYILHKTTSGGDFDFGSGDFTIEGWMYPFTLPTNSRLFYVYESYSQILLGMGSSSSLFLAAFNSSDTNLGQPSSATGAVTTGNWQHFAAVRNGGNLTLYVNGTQVAQNTGYSTNTIRGDQTNVYLGYDPVTAGRSFDGFLSDIRVVKGHAVYTSNFTPPTTALSSISGTGYSTVLLAQPGKNSNLNRDTAAPEDRKVFAAISAGIGQEPQTVINEGTSITSTGADGTTYTYQSAQCVPALPEGKWYFEVRDQNFSALNIGLISADFRFNEGPESGNSMGSTDDRLSFQVSTGYLELYPAGGTADGTYHNTGVGSSPNPNTGAIFGFDYDTVTNTFGVSKNGGTRYTHVVPTSDYVMLGKRIGMSDGSSFAEGNLQINFGQNPTFNGNITPSGGTNSDGSYPDADGIGGFLYAPPTGYKALRFVGPSRPAGLNKAALAPDKHFGTLLYTGNGSTQSIVGLGFQPDLVWLKERSSTSGHRITDVIRGVGNILVTEQTNAEDQGTNRLTSFDANGFSVGSGGAFNESDQTYVAWCWKAGEDSFINTDGTTDSECSVNQDAGFSIVSYVGTGANATVGHGLAKAPEMIICKGRQVSNNWLVYVAALNDNNRALSLSEDGTGYTGSHLWNDTDPTSTVFTVGTAGAHNTNNKTTIAYCWHSVEGYSKFGSYEGNGNADGPFVYLGFRPAFLIRKNVDAAGGWYIVDNKRNPENPVDTFLDAKDGDTDGTGTAVDFLSNGFKIRNGDAGTNTNNNTFIYMAFAEAPSAFTNSR